MKTVSLVVLAVCVTAVVTVAVMRRSAAVDATEEAPVSSIQELMEGVIDPSARAVFESVGVIATPGGTEERQPRTDEEWAAVERSAAILAETATLLKTAGRPVSTEAEAAVPVADSPDHSPAQIQTKISDERPAWNERADALRAVALRARDAARARSVNGLYEVGGDLDLACENCHQTFWYNPPPGVTIRR